MNRGLNLKLEKEQTDGSEELFGAYSTPCIAVIPRSERIKSLPVGERQNIGEEKMDCASRSPINILETKFNFLLKNKKIAPLNEKWLKDNGYIVNGRVVFSDAFIAILSGTTEQGNSLKAPLQAIHTYGLIPKSLLPQGNTFKEHHDPKRITEEMKTLGMEFLLRFPIRYGKVYEMYYEDLLTEDMLNVAGYAWPSAVNGEYPRTNLPPNHAFVAVDTPKYTIFDNYEEAEGDFIKKLANDYDLLDYGYRVYITAQLVPEVNLDTQTPAQTKSLIQWLFSKLNISWLN